jgi:DNA modification methylase
MDTGALPRWTQHELLSADMPGPSNLHRKPTPKRPLEDTAGFADVFPYYAGFSYDWARSCIETCQIPQDAVVLDPWNGSGTTTLAAQRAGFRSIGIDLNPIANVVARLRSCTSLGNFEIIPSDAISFASPQSEDALAAWFKEPSVARLRSWSTYLSSLSGKQADLGLVALFRTVRKLTTCFEGTNPRRARSDDERLFIAPSIIDDLITAEQKFLLSRISEQQAPNLSAPAKTITGSSKSLPIKSNCVDFILTSPPYLTRIDYAVAYTRELAVMGIDISRDRSLRSNLMGTTLIRKTERLDSLNVGPTAKTILTDISEHKSKASSGYYSKQARQYFDDLLSGLDEVSRVAKSHASLCLVVQDSYYKDVHLQLADVCIEECMLRGWKLVSSAPYPVKRTLTSLNTQARKYKKSDVAETVIKLRRIGS